MDTQQMDMRELRKIRLHKVLLWALVDWTIIGSAFFLLYRFPGILTFMVAALIIGNRQHALGIIAHEGAHGMVSRNRFRNDLITNLITFWPLGGAVSGYRGFHVAHHKTYLSATDPERVAIHNDMGSYFTGAFRMSKVFRTLVADCLGLNAKILFLMVKLFNEHIKPKEMIVPTLLQLTYWTAAIWSGYWYLPVVWHFAMASSYIATFRIRIWLEHIGVHETHRTALPRWFAAIFAPHNTSHHWEHHRYPRVPFYNLPLARKLDKSVPLITLKELIEFHRKHNVATDHFMNPEVWKDQEPRKARRHMPSVVQALPA